MRLQTQMEKLEEKLKSQCDDDLKKKTQVKLSRCGSVRLDKMTSKYPTICSVCNAITDYSQRRLIHLSFKLEFFRFL